MFKWFQNQFFIFPFLQFFPLIIDYISATTALWRSGLCIEIKLSSYAFGISNNKILLTLGSIFWQNAGFLLEESERKNYGKMLKLNYQKKLKYY